MNLEFESGWSNKLKLQFEMTYFKKLMDYLNYESSSGKLFFPKSDDIFRAFQLTPFKEVRVVILGQDPYHKPHQADGLCFSVPDGVPKPPSLQNIFKELESDLGILSPSSGNLSDWAKQGVLMLNTTLTVEAHYANSHKDIGWQLFTDAVIKTVSEHHNFVVFVLWGRFAQSKLSLIDTNKHVVIQSAHPSPLSAYQGFLGSKPFSKINTALVLQKKKPIRWG
jgi:uracil-DNA glycosylase